MPIVVQISLESRIFCSIDSSLIRSQIKRLHYALLLRRMDGRIMREEWESKCRDSLSRSIAITWCGCSGSVVPICLPLPLPPRKYNFLSDRYLFCSFSTDWPCHSHHEESSPPQNRTRRKCERRRGNALHRASGSMWQSARIEDREETL